MEDRNAMAAERRRNGARGGRAARVVAAVSVLAMLAASAVAAGKLAADGPPPSAACDLLAGRSAEELRYGHALAACDGWVAVASPMLDDDAAELGAVDVYRVQGDVEGPRARLVARLADGEPFTGFGASVAAAPASDGAVAVAVGCPTAGSGAGAIVMHLVHRDGAVVAAAPIAPASAEPGGELGATLALDGPWLAAGAPRASSEGRFDAGRVSVFVRREGSEASWIHAFDIPPPNAETSARFGASIALHGGLLVVASPNASVVGPDGVDLAAAGAVDLFRLGPRGARHVATLHAPKPARWARFGCSLAMDAEVLAIGADGEEYGGTRTGAVHILAIDGAGGTRHVRRVPPPLASRSEGMGFGAAIAVRAPLLLAGAPGADLWIGPDGERHTTEDSGSAWIFDLGSGDALAELTAPQPLDMGRLDMGLYGSAVAIGATRAGEAAAFVGHRFVPEEATGAHPGVGVYGR